jgi:ribosome-binding protein aMBF1 (putative translation factor)
MLCTFKVLITKNIGLMNSTRIERFLALVSDETSGFEKKALWMRENEAWLEKSGSIAIKVLMAIDTQGTSQKELAEKMGVSAQYVNKIVKGNENLSLETISKLEAALGIQLIEIVGYSQSSVNKDIKSVVKSVKRSRTKEKPVV